jgi:hypothetical protein
MRASEKLNAKHCMQILRQWLQVRLAYAGLELPVSDDGSVFAAKRGITKLFTMRRAAAAAQPSSLPTEVTVQTVNGKVMQYGRG